MTGDFNGDGADDLVAFTRGPFSGASSGDVFVSLSDGDYFYTAAKWHDAFAFNSEVPKVGDFNGDGKDDIASFMRGPFGSASSGDVFVALSNGSLFGYGYKCHEAFSFVVEVPEIGDLDGDGRDDAFTFARGGMGKVFVALSEGYQFGYGALRKTGFCLGDDLCAVGDVSGEGLDDVIAFKRR